MPHESDISPNEITNSATTRLDVDETRKSANASSSPKVTFPDGGLVAWLNVLGSLLFCFMTVGITQSFGVFQDYYTRVFLSERTPSEISWIGSAQIFLMFFLSPISGKLFDEGYFKMLLISASLLFAFCYFMLSITQPHHFYQVFLSQGIGLGLASGFMFLPAVSIIPHYFSARRNFAMGIVIAGSSVAGIVIPIMLNHLFNNPKVGFAWSIRYLGFIFLAFLLIANLSMKARFNVNSPRPRGPSQTKTRDLIKKLFMDVPYLLAVVGLAFIYWGLYFPVFYLQLFAILHGINTTLAFYSITILNTASLIGRTVPNLVADSFGPMNILSPGALCSGLLAFLMFAAKTVPGLIMFAILYGFFSGSVLSLSLAGVASFSDDISEVGIRCGFAMFFESFTLLTGTPLMGALLDAPRYTWHRPIIASAIFMLAGAACLLLSRALLAKRRGRWRV